jgi:Complex I intermediate-associated protein 30 (CIA30)
VIVALAGAAPACAWPGTYTETSPMTPEPARLVLSNFESEQEIILPGTRWRGFSDRVMGGVSDAEFTRATVAGRRCVRLTGHVTRDSGGGFIQMALDLGSRSADFDGSAYAGVEFLVYGNDEDYNVHVRTADCGWYDDSYRVTFHAEPRWQRVHMPWAGFKPNSVAVPLNPAHLQRIALLGWMREFTADLALAEVALYS